MIERTLVLIKPDGVQRALSGEIINRFEKAGLKIVGLKMMWIDKEFSKKHYSEHIGKKFYEGLEKFITEGPLIAMVLEGVDAVKNVRRLVGSTAPNEAMPGTIRGDYAHVSYEYADKNGKSIKNLIHASGNKEDAEKEIDLWFAPEQLFEYKRADENHVF